MDDKMNQQFTNSTNDQMNQPISQFMDDQINQLFAQFMDDQMNQPNSQFMSDQMNQSSPQFMDDQMNQQFTNAMNDQINQPISQFMDDKTNEPSGGIDQMPFEEQVAYFFGHRGEFNVNFDEIEEKTAEITQPVEVQKEKNNNSFYNEKGEFLDEEFTDFENDGDFAFKGIPELEEYCDDVDDKLTDEQMDNLLRENIRQMLFGFGDARIPKEETVDELLSMTKQKIIRWLKEAKNMTRREKPDLMATYYLARSRNHQGYFNKSQDLLKHYGEVNKVLKSISPTYKPKY